jgi:hypothetical protein
MQKVLVVSVLLGVICFTTWAVAAPYRTPIKPAKALIVEFGFLPRFGANAKIAHAATQAVAQELNRGPEAVKPQINTHYLYPDETVLYRVENLPFQDLSLWTLEVFR